MEINFLEESKNKLVVEIKGESHSLCNVLKAEVWKNKAVKISGYQITHPLVGVPRLVIETTSGNPRQILIDAAKNIKKDAETFLKAFTKTVK